MGNVLLDDYKKDDPMQNFDKWLQENSQLTGKQVLTQNKLFQTSSFHYSSKRILLKVYFKRDSSLTSDYLKSFQIISSLTIKNKIPNILPLSILNQKQPQIKDQNLIMATRQYLPYTLEQKLQRRPHLTLNQKKWYIYQMIMAIDVTHNTMNLYHGNVRTSNFLVTGYQYLFLTDFANYKPTYILEDTQQGLAEFRLFYQSSQDKCNLAPQKLQGRNQSAKKIKRPQYLFNLYTQNESDNRQSYRFSTTTSNDQKAQRQLNAKSVEYFSHMNNLKEMDLFSLSLCILEVLNDGKSTFTYENLLNLKKGKFNIQEFVDNVISSQNFQSNSEIKQIKDIVTELLTKRSQIKGSLVDKFSSFMKDQVFVLLWHCLSCFTKVSFQIADHRIYLFQNIIEFIEKQIKSSGYKFEMKRAKCLQNFSSLKIFAELIKKKLIYRVEGEPRTLMEQILNSVQKKDVQSTIVESDEQTQKQMPNQRQSFFINESRNRSINKRNSFMNVPYLKIHHPKLCPAQFCSSLQKLLQQNHSERRLSSLSFQQRKKSRLQRYLRLIRQQQPIRQQKKIQKSNFYSNYQLIIKIIFSCVRNCRYVASKMVGIELINVIAEQSNDCTLLRVVIPYFMHLSQDQDVSVAKYAFNSLLDTFYRFIDPFQSEEDIAYYQILLDFFLNTIKSSNIRIYFFCRFTQIYNICEWLQVHYLKLYQKPSIQVLKVLESSQKLIQKPPTTFSRLVDFLKIYYGTFSPKQIQVLMQNIPIAILPQMFQFYISFLNTQKISGLKCSLFIAKNATKQFQMQRHIIEVFDNCIQTSLSDSGIALYFSIIYFTIRKNTNIELVHKILPHIINPHRWVRDQAYKYMQMCLQQYPPTKIFFLFRDILQAPFPLTLQNLSQKILLPLALKDDQIDIKNRKITSKISRKLGICQQKFMQYLKTMKTPKQTTRNRIQQKQVWQIELKKFRILQPSINNVTKNQVQNFNNTMKKTIEQLYENNFFNYVFQLAFKFNTLQRQNGLDKLFDSLKRYSKFNIDMAVVTQEQKQFFESLFATINSNFQKFLAKHILQLNPQKFKLSLCINIISEQVYLFQQFRVKPSMNFGVSNIRNLSSQIGFRPKGILISEIYEHKDTITGLVSIGESFLLSSSHDGHLRIYSTKSIQMNITTQSQGVYQIKQQLSDQLTKINALTCLSNTYTAIIGTNKGMLKGYQIQRMPGGKIDNSRSRNENKDQLFSYNVGGEIEKLVVCTNTNFSQSLAYVTSQGVLGIQDIRTKSIVIKCDLGKERGFTTALASNDGSTLLVSTLDGYLLTYDVRFNLISSVLQLYKDEVAVPITNIIKLKNNQFCITYPALKYEFAQFNLQSSQMRIQPSRLYSSRSALIKQQQNIVSLPYFENKSNEQGFTFCNNSISKHIYYSQLSNFDKTCKILDYVSEPLTLKQQKIRSIWSHNCKHRYTQIISLHSKRSLPFVQYLPNGILTNLNPLVDRIDGRMERKDLTFLVDRKELKIGDLTGESDVQIITNWNKTRITQFKEEQNKDYFVHHAVVNGMLAMTTKNNRVKLYK